MVEALISKTGHYFWGICNEICDKQLEPFLPEIVKVLERHRELTVDAATRQQLLSMSVSTIDRRLAPFKQREEGELTLQRVPPIFVLGSRRPLLASCPLRGFIDKS